LIHNPPLARWLIRNRYLRLAVGGGFEAKSADAEARYGASVFWLREGMLPDDLLGEFFDTWQTKRDGTKRGIVEVTT